MTEGELKQLEVAYNKGVSLDVMRQALIDGGQEQGIQEVEDFFKKKKRLWSRRFSLNLGRFILTVQLASVDRGPTTPR